MTLQSIREIVEILSGVVLFFCVSYLLVFIVWGAIAYMDKDSYNAMSRVKQKHGIILNFEKLAYYNYKESYPTLTRHGYYDKGRCFYMGTSCYLAQFFVGEERDRSEYSERMRQKYGD